MSDVLMVLGVLACTIAAIIFIGLAGLFAAQLDWSQPARLLLAMASALVAFALVFGTAFYFLGPHTIAKH